MSDDAAHRVLLESAALYAIGALPEEGRRAFEAHARTCDACTAELRGFHGVTLGLAMSVPQLDPPSSLRAKVLRNHAEAAAAIPAVRMPARATWNPAWLSAAAMLVVAVALAGYIATLRNQIGALRAELHETIARLERSDSQLNTATRAVAGAQLRMAVLMAPDLARVDLAGQAAAPRASGRAFWSRSRGLVFAASSLPPLPAGRTYQLWVVTAVRPISAGLVRPDTSGAVTAFFATPADIPPPTAMAVTIEPEGGVPAPTGDRYLVGAAH
jgi:anti-sigma-K factor RskA